MNRNMSALAGLALIAACLGCSMGQTPYDYCTATIRPDGTPTGNFMFRNGSILGGMPGAAPTYQSQPTLAPPAAAPAAAAGSEVVPTGATSAPSEAAEGEAP